MCGHLLPGGKATEKASREREKKKQVMEKSSDESLLSEKDLNSPFYVLVPLPMRHPSFFIAFCCCCCCYSYRVFAPFCFQPRLNLKHFYLI